jgi:nucleotide-binding universal stress UspA family protein
MTKVLACIDNSAAARPVLEAACAVAPLFGASVEAVHVAHDGDSTVRAAADVEHVPLTTLHGDVVKELAVCACADDVVAVAVGTRNDPSGRRATGHVALGLANCSDAPLLIVPPDSAFGGRVERVLIAMKGTPTHAKSLKRAVELVNDAKLELVVVHVDDDTTIPSFSDQVQHETDAYAREFLARYVPAAPHARLELRIGGPADEILRVSEATHPDVIAMGWRQGEETEHGEVVREVLERIDLPVLLIAVA